MVMESTRLRLEVSVWRVVSCQLLVTSLSAAQVGEGRIGAVFPTDAYKSLVGWYVEAGRTMGYASDLTAPLHIRTAAGRKGQHLLVLSREGESRFTFDLTRKCLQDFRPARARRLQAPGVGEMKINEKKEAVQLAHRVLRSLRIPHGNPMIAFQQQEEEGVRPWAVRFAHPPLDGIPVGYGGTTVRFCGRTGRVLTLKYEPVDAPDDEHAKRLSLAEAQALAFKLTRDELGVDGTQLAFGKPLLIIEKAKTLRTANDEEPQFIWMLQVKIKKDGREQIEVVGVDCFREKAVLMR